MKKLAPYVGSLGLGFLLAGTLLGAMQRGRDYWAGFLIAGLALCAVYVASRWNELSSMLGTRATKEGVNAAILTVIVLGILVLINYIADEHAVQWDSTATKQYSLSDQTTKILAELGQDVRLVLLDRRGTEQQIEAEDLLQLYADESPRVDVEIIDPEVEPERALLYTSPTEPVTLGTILVIAGERRQRATAATEPEVTSALIRALKSGTKKIYFTSGHEEKDLFDHEAATGISVIAQKLGDSAYEPEPVVIARSFGEGEARIPDDAAAVVVAGPRTDFLPSELDALDAYIDAGGSVIFLVDPENQGVTPELVAFIVERGIVLGNDVVIDALAQPPVYPVVQSYGRHPIVASFGNIMSIFPLARSVTPSENPPEGTEVRELFTTADESSWAETRLDELAERQGPADEHLRGPIGLAMAATIEVGDGSSRVVVVGDSDFIANELAAAPLLNADLFLNMVNWAAEDEDLIAIRPREPEERSVSLDDQQMRNVFFLSLVIIPGIVIVTGVSLWWSRR